MNSLRKVALIFTIALSAWWTACTSIGPHPQILALESEIKATPNVDKILAAPTTGTGPTKSNDDLNKAVPAAAYTRYKDSLIIAPSLEKVLSTLRQPKVAPILLVNWQAAFYQWIKEGESSDPVPTDASKDSKIRRPKKDLTLTVAAPTTPIPKNDKDLKALAKVIKKDLPAYHQVAETIANGSGPDLVDAAGIHKEPLDATEALLRSLLTRLQISYMLLSHLEGDPASFNKNAPVVLHVALVNVDTGKFRYYARSIGRKSEVPATYPNLIGIMARNMFDDLSKSDHIEAN